MQQKIDKTRTLPQNIIDIDLVSKLNLSGRGGGEAEIGKIFKGVRVVNRVNNGIYDFEIEYKDRKYFVEIKKQELHQWFDVGKYHNISEENKKIIILFIMHKKGRVQMIAAISLDDFLYLCTSNSETRALGWTEEVIKIASEIKIKHPALQFKVKAYINKLIKTRMGAFDILYENKDTSNK